MSIISLPAIDHFCRRYCKFKSFRENFIFANGVKRHIWDKGFIKKPSRKFPNLEHITFAFICEIVTNRFFVPIKLIMLDISILHSSLICILADPSYKDELESREENSEALPVGYLFPCSHEINRLVPLFPQNQKFVFFCSLLPNIVFVPLFPSKFSLCSPNHLK